LENNILYVVSSS